jgi:hypothetical protein
MWSGFLLPSPLGVGERKEKKRKEKKRKERKRRRMGH